MKLFNTVGYMSEDANGYNNLIPNDVATLKGDVIFSNLLNTKEDELNYKKVILSMSVINAIRNKLVHRIFAMVKDQKLYDFNLQMS